MKRLRILPIVLTATVVTAVVAIALRDGSESGGDWVKPTAAPTPVFSGLSIAVARERSQADGRLLILDFTADWCRPCKLMEATTWRDQQVIDWVGEHALVVQVDVDQLAGVAAEFKIEAMPTVIVERDGEEVDRSRGFMSASGVLRWLRGVRSGEPSLAAVDLGAPVRYLDIPDAGSANAYGRLSDAKQALQAGRFDEALAELEWLWAHGAEQQQTFSMARLTALPSTMKSLVEVHPPARESFGRLLEVAQREVDAGRVGLWVWADWTGLCDVTGETARPDDWFRQHSDPDGSIDDGDYWRCTWIAQTRFSALVEQQRYAEAGRVYRNPLALLQQQIDMIEMASSVGGGAAVAMGAAFAMASSSNGNDAMCELAASISATLIAAGRDADAIEVGEFLLSRVNNGASRKALITKAIDWAHPLPPHVRWYAEAVELGADVEDLEPALQAALHR